jgi:cardiolipin synthase
MEHVGWVTAIVFLVDLVIRVGLSVRVIMRRLPVGVTLAWLLLILIFPGVGAVLYLLVGEYRLGGDGARRRATRAPPEVAPTKSVQEDQTGLGYAGVARLAESLFAAAVLPGNRLELKENAEVVFPSLIADIDQARRTCDLEFYIWSNGGKADEVAAAVIRAARRGVVCRVLVDAVGSAEFLRSALAQEVRQSGAQLHAALRVGLFRLLFARPDLRLHRKIVVIDGEVGYTGSMNLADPRFFKQNAGVGQWVDALVRIQGPAVDALSATFAEDWAAETGAPLEPLQPVADRPGSGSAAVQVLPSGPDKHVEAIEQVVLMAVYSAREELVLTTPYFVPSESLLIALTSAAARGVKVTLIVPAKVDSKLVRYASRAQQVDLLAAGAQVALFQGGLLHTKSITVDGKFSLFGSLNLDPRSMRLDFEITLAVYDVELTRAVRQLQQSYLDRSEMLDMAACRARSAIERFTEDSARLVGPLL